MDQKPTVFNTKVLPQPAAKARVKSFQAAHPETFAQPAEAITYLRYIFTDAQGLWCFRTNGKTGTTSTLFFLFHLTFGIPLKAVVRDENSINEDQAGHSLHKARVFSSVCDCGTELDFGSYLARALRLTTVRHPFTRALSGFIYLCRAHDMKSDRFLTERLRMCALTQFDWDKHAYTVEGFERFLTYLEQDLAHHATRPVDSHFRPQVLNILPDVFCPDLIGRCEDLPTFFANIAARLDRPAPQGALEAKPRNTQQISDRAIFDTPDTRRRVGHIFAADFLAFGYDQ
ncbi:MAG: sulfotransferase family 2 domain-containing protein [Tateyamaria sp.]